MTTFKDNFSAQAATYAKFRPTYPDSLFEYLSGLCPERKTAWDCATGNGQCAIPLTRFFQSVIATDASEKQLSNAQKNPKVDYRLAPAEESGLTDESIDLITVAQALHWFQLEHFWTEARRVLRPKGVIAVWCYAFLEIAPEIDAIVNRFYSETVGPYWDFERTLVEDGYRTIAFPFAGIAVPKFAMSAAWSLAHLVGYLQSWSATQNFIAKNRFDPTQQVGAELAAIWGDPSTVREVQWPLHFKIGRKV